MSRGNFVGSRKGLGALAALVTWLLMTAACAPSVDVDQERTALLALDREWSQTTKDMNKFVSYYAPDAAIHPPGMTSVTGSAPIMDAWMKMPSSPGFSLAWTPVRADVGAAGDVGYTFGTYEASMNGVAEKGKYIAVWKKQPDGTWKAKEDIYNADTAGPAPAQQVIAAANSLKWGDAPPVLPKGAKLAVVAGDPGKAETFAVRLQMPAGYKIAPHWHPTDEHVTVISGTFGLGMGDTFQQVSSLPQGGYAVMPATMHHYATAVTATTVQVEGMGPFVINYINAADDPSKAK
jgi:ketosteroid isomerase-like protein/quercetin dioxygenase-like cupin family protein